MDRGISDGVACIPAIDGDGCAGMDNRAIIAGESAHLVG